MYSIPPNIQKKFLELLKIHPEEQNNFQFVLAETDKNLDATIHHLPTDELIRVIVVKKDTPNPVFSFVQAINKAANELLSLHYT